MPFDDELQELRAREARALAMGGPERLARRQRLGLMNARSRIDAFIVIMRKSYGQAYLNMGGGRNSDNVAAWPTAEVSFMDPDYATEIVNWGRTVSDDDKQRTRAEMERDSSAYGLAEIFAVQAVIAPQETRRYLAKQLAIHEMRLSGGVGRHRMAGWPTTF